MIKSHKRLGQWVLRGHKMSASGILPHSAGSDAGEGYVICTGIGSSAASG